MLTTNQIALLDAMIDADLLARRRANYDAVQQRQQNNASAVAYAAEALKAAEAARSELLARSAAGEGVTAQASVAAERKVRDVESHLLFLRDAAGVLARELQCAEDAMNAAQHDAAARIAAHGAAEYLAAAARHDAALVALAQAEADVDDAADIVRFAQSRGYRTHGVVGSTMQNRGWTGDYVKVFPTAAQAREQLARAGLPAEPMEKAS